MKRSCLGLLLLACGASANQQALTLTPYTVAFPSASLEENGKVGQELYGFTLEKRSRLNQQWLMSWQLEGAYSDFNFSRDSLLGGRIQAWDSRTTLGVGINVTKPDRTGLTWFVGPRLQWSYADTASFADGFGYGLLAGASYPVSEALTLGLGGGYFNDPYNVRWFPVLFIKWQITDKLKLHNPFEPGFAGRGGLELAYRFNPTWELGAGVAYRTQNFALGEGAVEIEQPLSFLRASFTADGGWRLSGYLGYRSEGEFSLHGPHGGDTLDLESESAFGMVVTIHF
ncbi:autotransporter outer membrane beta-barrel domain-containing protein [Ferrimonas sediminicola]|uniref:Autotransporter outer membrane beta-barrel domain-containing protein n=1 Tax=Ferrimonas sediminicola TaxID=2569538 RepID=A0A4U1BKS0_9GAMM|nr:autotransporter outer membrane beta-barrel domain-containing protein [Ferrimonas sediminicola]TKB51227.1 autotransporter outer membrane beta-barrel domain-containing protein [Ferrimonas sediminicola]